MRNITVEEFSSLSAGGQDLEIVERKGLGHPDSICDAIMDRISVALCAEYLDKFGSILHHNVDKSLLVAGQTAGAFGGGDVIDPMLLVIGDRATFEAEGVEIDVSDIAIDTASKWFAENMRFVEPDFVEYQVELKHGSAELIDLFKRGGGVPGSNDTSAAVGYAPLSFTEKAVLDTERYLNSSVFKSEFPESGEDIKVMGVRKGDRLNLTVAMPLVDRFVGDEKHYFLMKEELQDTMNVFIQDYVEKSANGMVPSLLLNNLDMPGRGLNGVYTTVTGTSAEDADCGQVGRGNRVNGIIPLNRPVSSEAAAGKNPVSHVGKIYNLLSHRIAEKICSTIPDVAEAYVWLLSDIGAPIDDPRVAAVQVVMEKGPVSSVKDEVTEVMDSELQNIGEFCMQLARGEYPVY